MGILTGVEVAAVVGEAVSDDSVVEEVCVGKRGGSDNVGRCHSESGMPATRVSTRGLMSGMSEGIGIGRVMRAGSRAFRVCRRVDPCLFERRFLCMVTWQVKTKGMWRIKECGPSVVSTRRGRVRDSKAWKRIPPESENKKKAAASSLRETGAEDPSALN